MTLAPKVVDSSSRDRVLFEQVMMTPEGEKMQPLLKLYNLDRDVSLRNAAREIGRLSQERNTIMLCRSKPPHGMLVLKV